MRSTKASFSLIFIITRHKRLRGNWMMGWVWGYWDEQRVEARAPGPSFHIWGTGSGNTQIHWGGVRGAEPGNGSSLGSTGGKNLSPGFPFETTQERVSPLVAGSPGGGRGAHFLTANSAAHYHDQIWGLAVRASTIFVSDLVPSLRYPRPPSTSPHWLQNSLILRTHGEWAQVWILPGGLWP